MTKFPLQQRTLALLAIVAPLLLLFVYVVFRSGPLAPVAVTVATVDERAIAPGLFGVGTVEARYAYKIGPTAAGRIQRLDVHVGDLVKAGQVLGEMDPVDLDDRVQAQASAARRAEAALREAEARQDYAKTQAKRYEELLTVRSTSEETVATRRQELQIADAALSAARLDVVRLRADLDGLRAQRRNLRLIAPADGLVAAREADPGTTVVAGQTVIEIIDPASLWINVRFDQIVASGLAGGLPARVVLRSRDGAALSGRVLRVEPKADAVTEELLAKVVLDAATRPLPPLGELAEVTVDLPPRPATPALPNAALRRRGDVVGVWKVDGGRLTFAPVEAGAADLAGYVGIRKGLEKGDQVVVYSEKALSENNRIRVVERLAGVAR
jgi:RND family efflux transporter MFP subunit